MHTTHTQAARLALQPEEDRQAAAHAMKRVVYMAQAVVEKTLELNEDLFEVQDLVLQGYER